MTFLWTPSVKGLSIFNNFLNNPGTPESAYMNAISTSAVIKRISELCDQGVLEGCQCDKLVSQSKVIDVSDPEDPFYWSGCNRHIKYGMRVARVYMDPNKKNIHLSNKDKNLKTFVTIQNNKAARKVSFILRIYFS